MRLVNQQKPNVIEYFDVMVKCNHEIQIYFLHYVFALLCSCLLPCMLTILFLAGYEVNNRPRDLEKGNNQKEEDHEREILMRVIELAEVCGI